VLDAESGDPLIGVTILVEGTRLGAKTNSDGKFAVALEPGKYTLTINVLGYEQKRITDAVVKAGDVRHIDITLKPAALASEEVTVTSKLSTETQTAQLLERKKAATMNDVIGAEQIRRAPDATSADAVKRMPGVTITGNKFVNIRGTSERYNNAMLNGATLTSTEPDKKAFSFDLLPSNLLDNAIVTKTFTPDLPANFSGGLVQLNTVNFPDKFSARLSIGGSDAVGTTRQGFWTSETGGSDWIAHDDGTRALPSDVPSASLLNVSVSDSQRTTIARSFANTWAPKRSLAGFNGNIAASIGDEFPIFDNDFGYIASITYKNGYDHSAMSLAKYNLDNSLNYSREGVKDVHSVSLGALVNLSYRLSDLDVVSLKNLYDRSADDAVYNAEGIDSTQDGQRQRFTSLHYTERSILSSQLVGEHTILPLGNVKVNWRFSHSSSTRSEPDLRQYVYNYFPDLDQWYMSLASTNVYYGGRFFNGLNEKSDEGSLDITMPIANSSKVKIGGMLDTKSRGFWARAFGMKQTNNAPFTLLFQGIDSIFAPKNFGPGLFTIDENTNPNDRYDAAEHLGAAYVMADLPIAIAEHELRAIVGARFESDVQTLNSSDMVGKPLTYQRKHNDVLPAVNLVYSLNEKMNVRAAWSNTLSRPEFREIAPFSFYDFETAALVQGNPSIDRVLIRNLDLRYEYYPTAGELVSVSLFHKRFGLSNELFGLLYPTFEGGAIEQTNEGSNNQVSWANASKPAINYGFEVEIRKTLDFLGGYLSNVTLTGNYANIVSSVNVHDLSHGLVEERPMQGQAPYTLNLGILLNEPTLGGSFSALFNTYGKRITEVDYVNGDLYEQPRGVLDISYTQPVGSIEIKYTGKDILAADQKFERAGHVERSIHRNPVHSLGLSIKL
jgi:hypothetical protein